LAENNLSSGKYDDASRQFQKLLGCDSVNREAREGLQLVKKAQSPNGGSANR
jgi:hypothetical protein